MNFEITEEEGKENVKIGKYHVLKSAIYSLCISNHLDVLLSISCNLMEKLKQDNQYYRQDLKFLINKLQNEVNKINDNKARCPKMIEKITDTIYCFENEIKKIVLNDLKENYGFCTKTEEERLSLVEKDDKMMNYKNVLIDQIKLATYEDLEFMYITLKKRKKK